MEALIVLAVLVLLAVPVLLIVALVMISGLRRRVAALEQARSDSAQPVAQPAVSAAWEERPYAPTPVAAPEVPLTDPEPVPEPFAAAARVAPPPLPSAAVSEPEPFVPP